MLWAFWDSRHCFNRSTKIAASKSSAVPSYNKIYLSLCAQFDRVVAGTEVAVSWFAVQPFSFLACKGYSTFFFFFQLLLCLCLFTYTDILIWLTWLFFVIEIPAFSEIFWLVSSRFSKSISSNWKTLEKDENNWLHLQKSCRKRQCYRLLRIGPCPTARAPV